MKKTILSIGLLFLMSFLITSCNSKPEVKKNKKRVYKYHSTEIAPTLIQDKLGAIRAISLKALQIKAKEAQRYGPIPQEILHLYGITKILGFVADDPSQDIILYGIVNSSLPPLFLEDFVIALRNAWYKYAEVEGNTFTYADPSCTIDPDPYVIKELSSLTMNYRELKQGYHRWKETCIRPMSVKAWGIPFNSRFNRVMVEADYYMKNIVSGSVQLNINGFTSLNDTAWSIMKSQVKQGGNADLPIHPFNRFWFYPGEYWFYGYNNDIFLKSLPVTLKTEEEVISSGGAVGTGKSDPLAYNFALSFSEHYSKIAIKKPIYAELEGLFRLVAIAKAIKYCQQPVGYNFQECCQTKSGLDIRYLLNEFPVNICSVRPNLPGIPDIKDFTFRNNSTVHYLWLPSCGGVEIKIDVSDRNIKKSNYERSIIQGIHDKTIQNKSQYKPFWDFSLDILVEIPTNQENNKILVNT
jgi:hypothetical protein